MWLHLGSVCSSGLTFFCAPQADPWSGAPPPWVAGLRNKIPACWVENIQIFFYPRQRMSRGVGAVRLKMGLSFKDTLTESTKTQSGRLWASWDIVRVSVLHPSALFLSFTPLPISIFSPVCLLSSPGGPTTAHCMHVLVLSWSEATFGCPSVSIAASGQVM